MPSWVPRWMRWAFPAVLVVGVAAFVIRPQLGEADDALDAARTVSPWLLLAASVAQAGSIACQVELTRVLLPRSCRPTFAGMARVEAAAMAVSHTVPGGTAAGTAVGYRLLTQDTGIPGAEAAFALAVRGVGAAVVLNGILWLALVFSIPAHGFDPLYTTAAAIGVALIGGFGVLLWLLARGGRRAERIVGRLASWVPVLDPERTTETFRRVAGRVGDLVRDRRLAVLSTAWSAGHWLLGAASLWIFLAALGHSLGVDELLVAFGLANVLAALPVTPKGLALVEGVLIPSLIGFGVAPGTATVAVIGWRLLSFWLPIPLGGLAYASLKVVEPRTSDDGPSPRTAWSRLRETADAVSEEVGNLRDWARRQGFRLRDEDD